jgi:purine nucleosidase
MIIIDTDIGSDVDDEFAIAYAITSGQDVQLITTVHGDTVLRGQVAKRLTTLLGVDIPVAAGERYPVKQRQIFTTGMEGRSLPKDSYTVIPDGVDTLISCIHENSGIDIVAIGPLTNIATALQRDPSIEEHIGHLYFMGNASLCGDTYHLQYRAHNLKVDPEAADVVFESSVPRTIITTPVAKQNYLRRYQLERLQDTNLHHLYEESVRWLDFIGYDVVYLYDPLVVHHTFDSSITTRVQCGVTSITTHVRKGFGTTLLESLLS